MTVTEQFFATTGDELFAVLIHPETYPRWLVGAKNIREVSPSWPAPGSYFKHTVGFGPVAIPDRTTVRALEAPTMLELLVRARPLLEAVVRFEILSGTNGCILRMTETPVGVFKVISPVAEPLIKARNERSLRRLHDVVSSR